MSPEILISISTPKIVIEPVDTTDLKFTFPDDASNDKSPIAVLDPTPPFNVKSPFAVIVKL